MDERELSLIDVSAATRLHFNTIYKFLKDRGDTAQGTAAVLTLWMSHVGASSELLKTGS